MVKKSYVPFDSVSRLSFSTESIFSKCCCCVPLRIMCFILGYLNLGISASHTLDLIALEHKPSSAGFSEVSPNDTRGVQLEQQILTQIRSIQAGMLIVNVFWLVINIACLVGLHKKRPGPIRVYASFASIRLLLTTAGFIYLVMMNSFHSQSLIIHIIHLSLAAYFILVYHIYALQLEREG